MALHELSSKKNVVLLGDREYKRYFPTSKNYHFFYDLTFSDFDLGSVGERSYHPKNVNKVLHTAFGSKIPMRFSAAMFNTFIRDNIPKEAWFAVTRKGFHWKKFDSGLVNIAVEYNHLVQQAVKDNTLNLLPLMLQHQKDTQQLKALYGKGLWKRLASTSKSRMKYLAPLIEDNPAWVEVRTGILHEAWPTSFRSSNTDAYAGLIAARLAPTIKEYHATHMIVRDTTYMATNQGEVVNQNWSLNRWKEEHDRLTRLTLINKYSPKPFCDVAVYEEDGYTFTLLNSQMDIATEGKTMHHCVASYAGQASRGKYAVFRVEGKGERATLGLNYGNLLGIHPREFYFDQCYGMMNSLVSEKLRTAALTITTRHNDYLRLRNGRTAGQGDEGSRAVLDNGREGVPLNQFLRGDAIHAVWIDDLNWA